MFSLAASVGTLALGMTGADQVGRLSAAEQQVWRRMEPAVVTVLQQGRPTGPAALIDSSGLFVAHRNAVLADAVVARRSDGSTIQLTVKGQDPISQLVLLQANQWSAGVRPFSAPRGDERPGGTLLAVLTSGPIRAEFVSSRRYGVVKPSHRLVPLTEFRFEAPAEEVGTALVFCENGELIGPLHATLASAGDANPKTLGNALSDNSRLGNILRNLPGTQAIGPSPLTVAYTAGPQVMRRVLAGFLSEDREVSYPTLGVMCTDAIGGGAVVQQVLPGSPAAQGGMKLGDVMLDINGRLISNQVDFARVMLDQPVGKKITVRVRRGREILLIDTVVAKSKD